MDLVVAMAPSVDEATMTKTFELIRPYLEVRLHTVCLTALSGFKLKAFEARYISCSLYVCYFQTKEPGMQKKAYRVLEEMCGGERDECRSFVVANLETLKVVLLETLKNASSPAKRVRLPCREK